MSLQQKLRVGVTTVLKYTLNPLTRRIEKSSVGPFALVRHVGRKSGRQYETPIILGHLDDYFVVELTYGPEVDWYKNVQAAGGCTLVWHRHEYEVNHLEPLPVEIGRRAFPLVAQIALRLFNRTHFVKMTSEE